MDDDNSQRNPSLFRLILDAGDEFPFPPPPGAAGAAVAQTATTTLAWSQTPKAARALALLPAAEQAQVLRYRRPCDAALSLGSYLLKHLAIVRACGVAWRASTVRQERSVRNGKPYFEGPGGGGGGGFEFNVSHHGRLVVLVGARGGGARVGIDVVRVDADRDAAAVRREGGFEAWVGVFAEVFAPAELRALRRPLARGGPADEGGTEAAALLGRRLRLFYAYWALKEAYIKMTGEALMAPWLRELEFREVRVPCGLPGGDDAGGWRRRGGERVGGIEAWLRGVRVPEVDIELQSLGEDYMVATAVDVAFSDEFPPFEQVEVERDIITAVFSPEHDLS